MLVNILVKNTKQKEAKIRKDIDRDFWLHGKEAVNYGIVDSIIS